MNFGDDRTNKHGSVRVGAVTLKDSHRMGDGPIFLKTSVPHDVDLSNEPTIFSAKSILLRAVPLKTFFHSL
jgi:hypothetical protein